MSLHVRKTCTNWRRFLTVAICNLGHSAGNPMNGGAFQLRVGAGARKQRLPDRTCLKATEVFLCSRGR